MEFFRQEYWSGLPFSSPGDLPYPGIESRSPTLQADSLLFEPPWKKYPMWSISFHREMHHLDESVKKQPKLPTWFEILVTVTKSSLFQC